MQTAAKLLRSEANAWLSVALTFRGLQALDVPNASLDSFSPEFREGMAARAFRLHDVGDSGPENWEAPFGSADVHVAVSATARIKIASIAS